MNTLYLDWHHHPYKNAWYEEIMAYFWFCVFVDEEVQDKDTYLGLVYHTLISEECFLWHFQTQCRFISVQFWNQFPDINHIDQWLPTNSTSSPDINHIIKQLGSIEFFSRF